MNSVERSLAIIEQIVSTEEAPTHADLAAALDIPKSSLSLILKSLQRAGYITAVGRKYYAGIRLATMVYRSAYDGGLRSAARSVMDQLASDTGESVVLGVEAPGGIIMIDQSPSPQPIRHVSTIGELRPLHATATGRVFLAFKGISADSLGPLPEITLETVTDHAQLDQILRRIRSEGYAVVRGEMIPDVSAISAPILSDRDRPIAALSVTGPTARMTDVVDRIWPLLRAGIDRIDVSGIVPRTGGGLNAR